MTASFSRRRRCIRSNEAAIAGVMLRHIRIGNSPGDEFRFLASVEAPLDAGEVPGACSGTPSGVLSCRDATASALISGPFNSAYPGATTHQDGQQISATQPQARATGARA